jgi:hypothetical protein
MDLRTASGFAAMLTLAAVAVAPNSGCSSSSKNGDNVGDGGGSSSSSSSGGCVGLTCSGDDSSTNIQLNYASCGSNNTTTLHGTVFDPAGKNPLYNVAVYVPNMAPQPFTEGVSCARCADLYTSPVTGALTDAGGNFTLQNMPAGDVPLVIQIGKWRRQFMLSNVKGCSDNDAASLAGTRLTLPKNSSQGDIPEIAISTGHLDSLECLIHRVGIDNSEYTGNPTPGPGVGHIHIFTGGNPQDTSTGQGAVTQSPKSMQSYQYLWDSKEHMDQFDVVLLSCEGQPTFEVDAPAQTVLMNYANAGGRVFASHYHYAWFTTGPFSTVTPPLAQWSTSGLNLLGTSGDTVSYPAKVVTTLADGSSFPEGKNLHQWLTNVHALTNDQLPIWYGRHNADITAANSASTQWIQLDQSVTMAPGAAQYFSFDTPIGSGGEACGRVVYSDLHVSGGINTRIPDGSVPPDYSGLPITPMGCADHDLTPQEKALEFMLFNLSACLTPPGMVPPPPQPK